MSWFFPPKDEIVFEGRLNFENNPKEFFEKLEKFFQRRKNTNNNDSVLMINVEKVDFIYPSTLVFLISLSETLEIRLGFKIKKGSSVHKYMLYCCFSRFFEIPPLPEDSKMAFRAEDLLPLEISEQLQDTESKAKWFIDKFQQLKSDEQFKSKAIDATSEVLRNIQQHSKYTKYYLLGQYYQESKNVRLCILDNGVGIKSHLTRGKYTKRHSYFRQHVSKEDYVNIRNSPANIAIEKSSIEDLSATKYQENSGAGINWILKDFSKPYDGTVTIISQDGLVQWNKGEKVESIGLPFELKGTMVSITVKRSS